MSNDLANAVKENTEATIKRLAAQDAKIDDAIREIAQKMDLPGDLIGHTGPNKPGKSSLAAIGASAEVKAFAADRSIKTANVSIPFSIKSVVGDVLGTGNDLLSVAPARAEGLYNHAGRRLSIFDVLPRLEVGSNAFEFNRLDGYANAAAVQAKEGAGKAEGTMPTALASVPVVTIAHYLKLSEQVLADAPALEQQVKSLLAYGVMAKASAEILAGATAGKIQGLATQATPYASAAGATLADAIGGAATALDVAGWNADTVVMHPNDLFTIRSERTTDGYVATGWAGGAEQTVWGLRAVADPSIAAGSPLVLDSSQVAILDRMQTRVEFGRSGTDMTDNLITALGECRIGLAVFSPSAVVEVALTA